MRREDRVFAAADAVHVLLVKRLLYRGGLRLVGLPCIKALLCFACKVFTGAGAYTLVDAALHLVGVALTGVCALSSIEAALDQVGVALGR